MAVQNRGNALVQLRTLFNVGAIGELSDGQLLERFATGRGEPRELAFAALVERHGAFVLGVCRSVLRDEDAAEDAFQATFLALARKAEALWAQDSLAPWLHQAAYRAALHDRSAAMRRRSHEFAAAALRPRSAAPTHLSNDGDLEKIIHEEIDRLPDCFRVAVVLCDLEGRTHEQAARHLGCAVGTVKSRLARGRKRLRGRLVHRGVASALVTASATAGGGARAALPAALAQSTVAYAATPSAVPSSVAVITRGVLFSMILRKVKLLLTAVAVVAASAAGIVALAQSGTNEKAGRFPAHAAENGPIEIVALASQNPNEANPSGANSARSENDREHHKIVLTSATVMDVTITEPYLAQIHSHRHIQIRALDKGFLAEVKVREGQAVKKGDLMFKIVPTLEQAALNAKLAERDLAQLERTFVEKLFADEMVSQNEVKLFEAKLAKAKVKAELAEAQLKFSNIIAPFDGIIGRLHQQPGSLVQEGDILTTLSDNSLLWVYFNVPEARYLEYMAGLTQKQEEPKIELELADGSKFKHAGKIGAIEAEFNNAAGNIAFRADFPNPDRLLRHGQTGTILMRRTLRNATVIPTRATYQVLDRRYGYVVDKDGVTHRREIIVQYETDGMFVVKKGVSGGDRIVLEGIRQVRDGQKVQYEFRPPEKVMGKSKNQTD